MWSSAKIFKTKFDKNHEAVRSGNANGSGNRGFSLAEVLVAIAIGTVLLTGVSTLIFTSLRFVDRGNARVEVQNESQRVMNLVADNIMRAEGLCLVIPPDAADSECILLGKMVFEPDSSLSGTFKMYYHGAVIAYDKAPDKMEMLLVELQEAVGASKNIGGEPYCLVAQGEDSVEATVEKGFNWIRGYVLGSGDGAVLADRRPWLMGSFISACRITLPDGLNDLPIAHHTFNDGTSEDILTFKEPLTLRIDLRFSNPQNNETIELNVVDDITLRNRLKLIYVRDETGEPISAGRGNGRMLEYRRT